VQHDEHATRRAVAQLLCSDVDARPVIRAIDELDRLDEWLDVAITLGVDGPQRRAIRQRRAAIRRTDAEVAFHQASEIAASDSRDHETEDDT